MPSSKQTFLEVGDSHICEYLKKHHARKYLPFGSHEYLVTVEASRWDKLEKPSARDV